MKFDKSLHKSRLQNFEAREADDSNSSYFPSIRTSFFAPDLSLQGLNFEVTAYLHTRLEKAWLGQKIKEQGAGMSLRFNVAWDGCERIPESDKAYDGRRSYSRGEAWVDPNKEMLVRQISHTLRDRLASMQVEVDCDYKREIRLSFKDDKTSPLEQIETIYSYLKHCSEEYEKKERDPESAALLSRPVRINPDLHPQKDFLPCDYRVGPKNWQALVQKRVEAEIIRLAKNNFPVGEEATPYHHHCFEKQITELVGRSRQ